MRVTIRVIAYTKIYVKSIPLLLFFSHLDEVGDNV